MAAFPFLLIPLALVNFLIFFTEGGMGVQIFSATLPSGANLALTAGDLAVLIGLIALYFEIYKSTRYSRASSLDHALSLCLFVIALLEFLLAKKAGNGAFLIITVMCLVDVIAGFTVSLSVARRDVGFTTPE
jgi:hypothetical protein